MKYLLSLLVLLALVSCNKNNDDLSEATTDGWPVPTCSKSSDDGRFETWNDSMKSRLYAFNPRFPDKELPLIHEFRTIFSPRKDSLTVTYQQKVNTTCVLFATLPSGKPWLDGFVTSLPVNSQTFVPTYYKIGLPTDRGTGCTRLYYAVLSAYDSGDVITKGHYDFEL